MYSSLKGIFSLTISEPKDPRREKYEIHSMNHQIKLNPFYDDWKLDDNWKLQIENFKFRKNLLKL